MKNNIDERNRYMIVVRVWVVIRLFAPDCTTKMYGWMRACLTSLLFDYNNSYTYFFSSHPSKSLFTHTYNSTCSGGFEDKMTRKEAALILGVRESSTSKRIKEAHRKLLILNHPDTGGSTYIAGKVNEAKELLLKGKKH